MVDRGLTAYKATKDQFGEGTKRGILGTGWGGGGGRASGITLLFYCTFYLHLLFFSDFFFWRSPSQTSQFQTDNQSNVINNPILWSNEKESFKATCRKNNIIIIILYETTVTLLITMIKLTETTMTI